MGMRENKQLSKNHFAALDVPFLVIRDM